MKRLQTVLAFVATAAVPALASAQTSTSDLERAERLFQEGKQAMADKRFDEGCPKLAESQRIDPATGTLLALALCHEGQGKLATALREFRQALPAAQSDKRRDREQLATAKIAEIAPRVPKLTITVASELANDTSLTVTLDGDRVEKNVLGTAVALDPGEHVIEATADARSPWRSTIKLAERETRKVTVPALARIAEEPAPAETPAPPFPTTEVGVGLVSAGGLALAAGAIFGISAINKNSDAEKLCENPKACSSTEALTLNDDARGAATASTVLVIGGLALAGGGVALIVLSNKKQTTASPLVGPGLFGLSARGAF